MTRGGAKEALSQQRAAIRRGARGKVHVGDDTGAAAGRARERVEEQARLDEQQHARDVSRLALTLDLASDVLRIVRTLVALPFRIAYALLPRQSREAA